MDSQSESTWLERLKWHTHKGSVAVDANRYSFIHSYRSWCTQALNHCFIRILYDDNLMESFCVVAEARGMTAGILQVDWMRKYWSNIRLNAFRSVLVVSQLFLSFCVTAWHKCTSTAHFLSLLLTEHVGGHVEMAFMQAYSQFKTIINQLPIAKSIISKYLSRFAWQPSFLHQRGLDLILLGFIKLHVVLQPSHSTWKP